MTLIDPALAAPGRSGRSIDTPDTKICSECGKEKCLRNDGPFGGCYAEPSIQHQKEVCHGHTPKPESEQTGLEIKPLMVDLLDNTAMTEYHKACRENHLTTPP
jgi:hypothetical protein